MFEKELEQEEKTLAAERGRSPSDAASVFGGPAEPTSQAPAVDRGQFVLPPLKPIRPSPPRQAPTCPRPPLCKRRKRRS